MRYDERRNVPVGEHPVGERPQAISGEDAANACSHDIDCLGVVVDDSVQAVARASGADGTT